MVEPHYTSLFLLLYGFILIQQDDPLNKVATLIVCAVCGLPCLGILACAYLAQWEVSSWTLLWSWIGVVLATAGLAMSVLLPSSE